MFKPPNRFFDVAPVATEWKLPSPQQQPREYQFAHSDEHKRRYGIELAKLNAQTLDQRTDAAITVWGRDDGNRVVWVAENWHLDPIVIEARDSYVPPPTPLLDKSALAAKLLACADESVMANGQKRYINEAKDRLGFYNLYSKIMGFIDKPDTTINQFGSNEMKIVLVKPDEKAEIKTIEHVKKVQETTSVTPLRIKAV